MTGRTHKQGGVLCSIIGFLILRSNGLLLSNVNEFLQLIIMYPFVVWGSTMPDLDHNWNSCPDKSLPNYLINKLLHLTSKGEDFLESHLSSEDKKNNTKYKLCKLLNAKHRSWQTHSEITLVLIVILLQSISRGTFNSMLSNVDNAILSLILMGVGLGVLTHLILDIMTVSGMVFVTGILFNKLVKRHILPEKIRIVPKMSLFTGDSAWEHIVQKVIKVGTMISVSVLFLVMFHIFDGALPYKIIIK